MTRKDKVVAVETLDRLIYEIRGHKVMLDADLAGLYGVTTKRLNEAVKRNPLRFPEDFVFQLTSQELEALRSQFATSNMRSQFVTGSYVASRRAGADAVTGPTPSPSTARSWLPMSSTALALSR